MKLSEKLRVKPGQKVRLADHDPDDTVGLTKKEAEKQLKQNVERLARQAAVEGERGEDEKFRISSPEQGVSGAEPEILEIDACGATYRAAVAVGTKMYSLEKRTEFLGTQFLAGGKGFQ